MTLQRDYITSISGNVYNSFATEIIHLAAGIQNLHMQVIFYSLYPKISSQLSLCGLSKNKPVSSDSLFENEPALGEICG
jgi:hypothetical protein